MIDHDRDGQVRSFYRSIEISEGFQGNLATHEAYFYALDALPLLVAIVVSVSLLLVGWRLI